jgi:predicted nucleic acid-binding protein
MKDKGILIDSDVIIWLLRGNSKVLEQFKKLHSRFPMYTTPITVAEIVAGSRKNEEQNISDFFQSIEVLIIDKQVGINAGEWMNKYSKSHSVELADALIASTTIHYDLRLWTMNVKHYPMLKKEQIVQ